MGSRNPSKIEKTPSLDPKISFLMLRIPLDRPMVPQGAKWRHQAYQMIGFGQEIGQKGRRGEGERGKGGEGGGRGAYERVAACWWFFC